MAMFVLPPGQKPFQCGLCSEAFTLNADLVIHVDSHQLTKPYQCGYCKVSFHTNDPLTVHVRAHKLMVCKDKVFVLNSRVDDVNSVQRDCHVEENHEVRVPGVLERGVAHEEHSLSGEWKPDNSGLDGGKEMLIIEYSQQKYVKLEGGPRIDRTICKVTTDRDNVKKQKLEASSSLCSSNSEPQKLNRDGQGNSIQAFMCPELCPLDLDMTVEDIGVKPLPDRVLMFGQGTFDAQYMSDDDDIDQDTLEASFTQNCVNANNCPTPSLNKTTESSHSLQNPVDGSPDQLNVQGENHCLLNSAERCPTLQDTAEKSPSKQNMNGQSDSMIYPYVCSLCGQSFAETLLVIQHFKSVHRKGEHVIELCPSDETQCFCHLHSTTDEDSKDTLNNDPGRTNSFDCYECTKQFVCRYYGNLHILEKHGFEKVRPFECAVCGFRFERANHLRTHVKRHGNGSIKLKSLQRKLNTVHLKSLKATEDCVNGDKNMNAAPAQKDGQHKTGQTEDSAFRPFLCSLCGQGFTEALMVGQHFRSVHRKGRHEVELCPSDDIQCPCPLHSTATDGDSIDTLNKDKISYECYKCAELFSHRYDCNLHVLETHGVEELRVFECAVCTSRFRCAQHIKNHFNARHSNDSQQRKMNARHLKLPANSGILKTTDDTVNGDKSQNAVGHAKEDGQHKTGQTSDSEFRPFLCSLCGQSFFEAVLLGQHFRSVHRKETHVVELGSDTQCSCPLHSTATKRDSEDMWSDGPGRSKSFQCYVCAQQFMCRYHGNLHIFKQHSFERLRPYECAVCRFQTKGLNHLKDHFYTCHVKRTQKAQQKKMNARHLKSQGILKTIEDCMNGGKSQNTIDHANEPGQHKTDQTEVSQNIVDKAEIDGQYKTDKRKKKSPIIPNITENSFNLQNTIEESPGQQKTCGQSDSVFHPFVCSLCGESFTEATYVSQHFISVHRKERHEVELRPCADTQCPCRHHSTTSEGDSEDTLNNDLGRRKFRCYECSKQFMCRYYGNQHILEEHGFQNLRQFECSACGFRFKSLQHLKNHCKGCRVSSKQKSQQKKIDASHFNSVLEMSVDSVNGEKHQKTPFLCSLCGHSFTTTLSLSQHFRSVHRIERYVVELCPSDDTQCPCPLHSTATDGDSMDTLNKDGIAFECYMCDELFSCRYDFNLHIMETHDAKELRVFECAVCRFRFKLIAPLKDHLHTCHGNGGDKLQQTKADKAYDGLGPLKKLRRVRPETKRSYVSRKTSKRRAQSTTAYQCQFCPRWYMHKSSLKLHIQTHTNDRPFMCDICGKSFPRKCSLECHQFSHTDKRPFLCTVCSKGFNSPSALHSHKLRRTGDKRYMCEQCGMKFHTLGMLKRHKVTHTEERPLSCKKCGKTYRGYNCLNYHMVRAHPE